MYILHNAFPNMNMKSDFVKQKKDSFYLVSEDNVNQTLFTDTRIRLCGVYNSMDVWFNDGDRDKSWG